MTRRSWSKVGSPAKPPGFLPYQGLLRGSSNIIFNYSTQTWWYFGRGRCFGTFTTSTAAACNFWGISTSPLCNLPPFFSFRCVSQKSWTWLKGLTYRDNPFVPWYFITGSFHPAMAAQRSCAKKYWLEQGQSDTMVLHSSDMKNIRC